MPYHDMDWSIAGWSVTVLIVVALLVVFLGLVAAIVRSMEKDEVASARTSEPDPADVARLILDERLARGQIAEDEYERKRDLVGQR